MKIMRMVKTQADRIRAVAAGARWMDKHYPNWFKDVVSFVRQNRFDITKINVCVIGAGTGHIWSRNEADQIEAFVRRSVHLDPTGNLTASVLYEDYWVAEAFQRVGNVRTHVRQA